MLGLLFTNSDIQDMYKVLNCNILVGTLEGSQHGKGNVAFAIFFHFITPHLSPDQINFLSFSAQELLLCNRVSFHISVCLPLSIKCLLLMLALHLPRSLSLPFFWFLSTFLSVFPLYFFIFY